MNFIRKIKRIYQKQAMNNPNNPPDPRFLKMMIILNDNLFT